MARDTGISLLNAATSAMDAYGFWQGIEDRKQMRGLREAAEQRDKEWHDTRMKDAEQSRSMREQSMRHAESRENRDIETSNLRRSNELLQNQEYVMDLYARQALMLEGLGDFKPTDQDQEFMRLHPLADSNYLLSEPVTKAFQNGERALKGEIPLSSPEVLDAVNATFTEVQAGAADGRKRRVTHILPGKIKDTVTFGLEVEGDSKPRPLTNDRSSRDDDPVKQVPVEQLYDSFLSKKMLRDMMASPQGRQAIIRASKYANHLKQNQESEDIKKARELQQALAAEGKEVSFDDAYKQIKTSYRVSGNGQGGNAATPKDIDKAARDHAYRMTEMARRAAGDSGEFKQDETFNRYYTEELRKYGIEPPAPPQAAATKAEQFGPTKFQTLDELLADQL